MPNNLLTSSGKNAFAKIPYDGKFAYHCKHYKCCFEVENKILGTVFLGENNNNNYNNVVHCYKMLYDNEKI